MISGNIIEENSTSGSGGGIHLVGTKAIVRNNTISENVANGGGGLLHTDYDSALVTVNIITYNTAFMGGGINTHDQSSPRITDNVISGNISNGGGGIFCHGENTSPAITHNVITGNRGDLGGGIHSTWYATPVIKNCELTRNNGDGVYSSFGSSPVVQFNNILSNNGHGVQNADESIMVDARFNWWGCLDGPSLAGPDRDYPGCGSTVSDYVDFRPWLRGSMGTQEGDLDELRAVELELKQNIPNPVWRETVVWFSINHPARVTLKVYNQAGREVETLIDGHVAAGVHSITWDAQGQTQGVYFLRLSSEGSTVTRRCLLMK
jgi:parallel beta-helix repeat protein